MKRTPKSDQPLKTPAERATERAFRILQVAATKSPAVVNRDRKLRIANIVAQHLHITTVDQALDFCKKYWPALAGLDALANVTRVVPKKHANAKPSRHPESVS